MGRSSKSFKVMDVISVPFLGTASRTLSVAKVGRPVLRELAKALAAVATELTVFS